MHMNLPVLGLLSTYAVAGGILAYSWMIAISSSLNSTIGINLIGATMQLTVATRAVPTIFPTRSQDITRWQGLHMNLCTAYYIHIGYSPLIMLTWRLILFLFSGEISLCLVPIARLL